MARHTTPSSTFTMGSSVDRASFRRLLARWNTHQDLRRSGAPVADLANSRAELDAARAAVRNPF